MQLFRMDRPLTSSWSLLPLSYNLLLKHKWPVFYLGFLPSLLIAVGITLIQAAYDPAKNILPLNNKSTSGIFLTGIGALYSLLTYPGLLLLQLRAVRGQTVDGFASFKDGLRRIVPFVITAFLATILVIMGLILFIVPGLLLIRGLYLSLYYVVDQKLGSVVALRRSIADSKPHAGYIWGTIAVSLLIGILGSFIDKIPAIGTILSILIGLFYMFAPAKRYTEVTTADATEPHEPAYPKL